MQRLAFVVLLAAACSSSNPPAKTVYFDLDTDLTAGSGAFWSMPFPSDVRVTGSGAPDVAGYPNPLDSALVASMLSDVGEHHGYPVMSTAYFRFTDVVPARSGSDVITDGSVVLLDIDPTSSEAGSAYPVIAVTLANDTYTSKNLVAIAPRPGIVLKASTQYAVVIRTAFAPGFSPAPAFADLAAGRTPSGTRGSAAVTAFANLWPALDHANIPRTDVLAATTFTTADEVARVRARSEAIRTADPITIDPSSLVLDLGGSGSGSGSDGSGGGSGSAGSGYDGFCHLTGTVTIPQFQVGTPPYDTQGTFVLDGSDVPQVQSTVAIPFSITLPKMAMPSTGFALYQFFHGSGGHSTDIVNLGPSPDPSDDPIPGYGPGYVVALHHIAAASSALPLNPERVPGASDYEYLNFNNLASFPYTFQEGAFEQRLFLDALLKLHIPAAALAGCDGISTSTSDGSGAYYFFDPAKVVGGGQSMGGMYTNIIGAIEPRYGALVPTGAGGFWNLMILETDILPGATGLVATLFDAPAEDLSFVHPALNVLALAWDAAEPIAYMNRIGERPLPGFTARDVYEPVGQGDSYFATDVYDAAALSYGHNEGGTQIWPAMQSALALDHLDGILPYPIKANRNGHTRAVIQYMGDGIIDPHYIYRQLPAVKFQYGCFLESYLADGVATIYAPGSNVAVTDPCPTP